MILYLVVACAPGKHQGANQALLGVEIKKDKKSPGPSLKIDQTPSFFSRSEAPVLNKEKEAVLGAIFGEGFLGASGYIGALKKLEKMGLSFHSYSGFGWGALFAVLFAKYQKASVVEWHFFKLRNSWKDLSFKSSSWPKRLRKILLTEFKSEKIESYDFPVSLLVYNSKTKQVEVRERGAVLDLILDSMKIIENPRSYRDLYKNLRAAVFQYSKGVDLPVFFHIKANRFKNISGFHVGLYHSYFSFYLEHKKEIPFPRYDLIYDDLEIDNHKNIVEFINRASIQADSMAEDLLEKTNQWKTKNQ